MPAPQIKICGLTTAAAVDAALAAEADYIGLVFFPASPRNVSFEQAAALVARAARRAKVVGLFVDPDRALLDAARAAVTLDIIQLHGKERPAEVGQIRMTHGLPVWKAIGVRRSEDLAEANKFRGTADRILYDAKPPEGAKLPGGTGLRIDWEILKGKSHPLPWMLAGGLTPRNVAEAVSVTCAPAVDVSSGVESAPGVKDAALIADFCKAARAA